MSNDADHTAAIAYAPSASYTQGESEPALLEETIGANFSRTADTYADREALVEVATGRRWTWSEHKRDVDLLTRGLIAAGLQPGDRVGIWAPNCAEWTQLQFAAAQAGAGRPRISNFVGGSAGGGTLL